MTRVLAQRQWSGDKELVLVPREMAQAVRNDFVDLARRDTGTGVGGGHPVNSELSPAALVQCIVQARTPYTLSAAHEQVRVESRPRRADQPPYQWLVGDERGAPVSAFSWPTVPLVSASRE